MSRRTTVVLVATLGVLLAGTPLMAALAAAPTGVATVASDTGVWTSGTPSGFKRQEITYVGVGDMAYLAGGKSTVQQAYDLVNHTWRNVAPLPVALDHVGAAVVNGLIYYIGGLDGYPGTSYGDVYVYHPATDRVSTAAPLPTGRDRGAAGVAVYQGKIYLAGGFHNGGSVAFFDSYDPATNSWTSLPNLPERRDHVAAAVVGNRMYVIGGRTFTQGPQSKTDAYDFTTGKWVTGLAPLPTARAGAATAVFGNEVLVIGGEAAGSVFANNEAYDTVNNTWRTLAAMPTARHGLQAVTFDGAAYLADGGTQMGRAPSDIQEVFSFSGAAPSGLPDCRVRLSSESKLLGNNIYNTTGVGQTRSVTNSATTSTFVYSLQNDNGSADALTLMAPASSPGFTVRYFAGLSGTTDITTKVVAGTYRTASLAPGAIRAVRIQVTVASGTPSGSAAVWLATVGSVAVPSNRDVCTAQLTVS